MPKPTSLSGLKTNLQTYYQKMHDQMAADDGFYYQDRGVVRMRKPPSVPIHMPSTATHIVDNLRDQIKTDEPVVEWQPRSSSQDAREQQSRLVTWGTDRFENLRLWSQHDVVDQWKHDLVLRGAAAAKILVDPDIPEDPDDRAVWTKTNDPFVVIPLDPLTVMPSPGGNRPLTYVLEVQHRTAAEIIDKFPEWKDPIGMRLRDEGEFDRADDFTRPVEWLEYWDANHYIVEVDGDVIIDEANPYDRVPYLFEYSGLGREHADGNPSNLARGLLTGIHGELQAEVRIKTAWDAQWQFHVFPILMVEKNSQLAEKMLEAGPGGIVETGALGNDKPEFLTVDAPNATMIGFLDAVLGNITRESAPVLSNPGQGSGSEFGILEAMRIGQALKVISPVVKSLNKLGGQLLNLMAYLANHQTLTFEVTTSNDKLAALGPEKFSTETFRVDFESVDAAENDRRLLIGQALHGHKLMSRRTFHEQYGRGIIDDPDSEEEQIMVEALLEQALQSGMLLQAVQQSLTAAATAQVQPAIEDQTQNILSGALNPEIATEALGRIPPGQADRGAGESVIPQTL